jgi:hypothetical protein
MAPVEKIEEHLLQQPGRRPSSSRISDQDTVALSFGSKVSKPEAFINRHFKQYNDKPLPMWSSPSLALLLPSASSFITSLDALFERKAYLRIYHFNGKS